MAYVGLVTGSAASTSMPAATPRTKQVLPEPSSPTRAMKSLASSSRPSLFPNAPVSASPWVTTDSNPSPPDHGPDQVHAGDDADHLVILHDRDGIEFPAAH